MAELRLLHLTDIEDNFDKYDIILDHVKSRATNDNSIDALLITGDFINAHQGRGTTADKIAAALQEFNKNEIAEEQEELQKLAEEHSEDGKVNLESLDEEVKKQFETLIEQINGKQAKVALKPVHQSYQDHGHKLGRFKIPIYGVFGNHDLTLGYDHLKKYVTFLEKTEKATVKGKTGIEFILKGDVNSFEFPRFHMELSPLLKDYFIPYVSGQSLSELSKKENELHNNLPKYVDGRLEKISKGEEPEHSEKEISDLKNELEYTIQSRKKVLEYQQAERQRLGNKEEVDIYLAHKLPHNDNARPNNVAPISGDITLEYSANANAIHGGHFHDGQIGHRNLADITKMMQEDSSLEKTTIDNQEVPVVYLNENEAWELNPGTNHFFVTEYNSDKQVEQVIIYQYILDHK